MHDLGDTSSSEEEESEEESEEMECMMMWDDDVGLNEDENGDPHALVGKGDTEEQ